MVGSLTVLCAGLPSTEDEDSEGKIVSECPSSPSTMSNGRTPSPVDSVAPSRLRFIIPSVLLLPTAVLSPPHAPLSADSRADHFARVRVSLSLIVQSSIEKTAQKSKTDGLDYQLSSDPLKTLFS